MNADSLRARCHCAAVVLGPWLLVAAAIGFSALVRLRLADMPLERDEGEYAYAAQLTLQGIPPYQLAFTAKLPGTHLIYALFLAALGQTEQAVRLGLLLVNAASVVLVFTDASWGGTPTLELPFFRWVSEFSREHYQLIGVADLDSPPADESSAKKLPGVKTVWGAEAAAAYLAAAKPGDALPICVLRKKPAFPGESGSVAPSR
jgi:hypothetical protein